MDGGTMTEGTPWKQVLRFALPVLASSLLQQLYNSVDTLAVENFSGDYALSAVGTTGSFAFLFLAIAMGVLAGNSVVAAQLKGRSELLHRPASCCRSAWKLFQPSSHLRLRVSRTPNGKGDEAVWTCGVLAAECRIRIISRGRSRWQRSRRQAEIVSGSSRRNSPR